MSATLSRKKNWPLIVVLLGIVLYAAVISWFSIGRAHNFNAGWYDLGIMTQTVWRTGHGFGFSFTNPEAGPYGVHGLNVARTAIHADYVLILLAPLSWLGGHTAEALLILQAIVVAAGGWFVYRLTRTLLKNEWLGVFFAWVYLLYPPLQFANLFEFHAVTLAVTFFLAAAEAIINDRRRLFWLWAGLALLSKEQAGITFGLLAAALWWWKGQRRLAAWSLGLSWAWVALQLLLVIPLSRPASTSNFVYQKFYASSGDDAGSVLQLLLHPRAVWHRLATQTHRHDLVQLLTPLGIFLPLAMPLLILALPEILIYWLSDSPNQQTLFLHYHALFIPFIFLGAVFGWRLVEMTAGRWGRAAQTGVQWTLILLVAAGTTQAVWKYSPWPWSPMTRWPLVDWKERLTPQVHEALKLIPPRASVALTQNLGPFLAARPVVRLLPTGLTDVEYIVILARKFDPNIRTNDKRLAEKVMLERLIPWLEASPAYVQRYHVDRVWVWQRTGQPTEAIPDWPAGLLGQN